MLEKLPEHPLLEYHTNTLDYVRCLYDLGSPGRMDEAIDRLDDWIKKQPFFTKTDFPREYLERTIISSKGSVERAKKRIEKVCMFRTLWPELVQEPDIKNIKQDRWKYFYTAQRKLTDDHYRIATLSWSWILVCFAVSCISRSKAKRLFCDCSKLLKQFTEHMKAHDYSTGIIYVIDYTETDLVSLTSSINPLELKDIVDVMIEGYGVRIKGIHMYTNSKLVEVMVAILKKILSEKIGGRITVNRDLESLHKVVPKEYLPKDYGGEGKSMKEQNEEWLEVLSSEENIEYQKKMSKACVIEAKMPRNEQMDSSLGINGTFRTLTLD